MQRVGVRESGLSAMVITACEKPISSYLQSYGVQINAQPRQMLLLWTSDNRGRTHVASSRPYKTASCFQSLSTEGSRQSTACAFDRTDYMVCYSRRSSAQWHVGPRLGVLEENE